MSGRAAVRRKNESFESAHRRLGTVIAVSLKHSDRPKSLRSRMRELEGRCGWQSADTPAKRMFFLRRIVLKDKRVTKPGRGGIWKLTYQGNPFVKFCRPSALPGVADVISDAMLYGSATLKVTR